MRVRKCCPQGQVKSVHFFLHESRKLYETWWNIMKVNIIEKHHVVTVVPIMATSWGCTVAGSTMPLPGFRAALCWSCEPIGIPMYTTCTTIGGFSSRSKKLLHGTFGDCGSGRRTDALRTSRLCDFCQMSLESRHEIKSSNVFCWPGNKTTWTACCNWKNHWEKINHCHTIDYRLIIMAYPICV